MPDNPKTAKDIFLSAIERTTPAERAAFLDEACVGNTELRRRVDALLRAHDEPGNILDQPAAEVGRTAAENAVSAESSAPSRDERRATETVADRIGPYKLLQKLGEGGMGTVWVAEQQKAVKRRVALKVIKPGMDSAQILRRFEAERQALALMDHANIAKVLDAGATDAGRPYFVMELVQGVPITRYCDELHLPVRERLALFIQVCQAIQHAHQKGIIHRDIKPSNVLVCMQDGRPIPKVIDFGVAKALHQRLAEESIYTEIGAIVGTLEYMSPEQVEMSPLGVDTRADVYALGVLLYELLTGFTPLDRQRLRRALYSEVVRLIKEEVPSKPSTRLTQSQEMLANVAALRRTEPARLKKELRGDLDWIVMRALEKDRTRRYEAASNLARDVERYLHDEPVEACPPSASYRLMKFVRRNKGLVRAVSALFLLLIAGIIGTSWGLILAERSRREADTAREAEAAQRQRAEADEQKAVVAAAAEKQAKETAEAREAETRAVLDFVENKVFAAARPRNQEGGFGRDVTLRKAVEAALPFVDQNFRQQPLIEARLRSTLGKSFEFLGDAKIAVDQLEKARKIYTEFYGPDHVNTLATMHNLAVSYTTLGQLDDALKLREETLTRRRAALGPKHPETLRSMNNLAISYARLGRYADALKLREETLALRRATLGPEHPETLRSMNNLASSYDDVGRHADSVKLYEETLTLRRAKLGPDHPDTLISQEGLALGYSALGRHSDALKLNEDTLALRKTKLGPDHPNTLISMHNLAENYTALGRHAEALKLCEETLRLRRAKLGPDHPYTINSMNNLAGIYEALGRHADALKLREETLALRKVKLGPDHADTLQSMNNLANCYAALGRHAVALKLHEETLALQTAKLGPDHPETLRSMYNIACTHALLVPMASDRAKQADLAMEWFKRAIVGGYKDIARIKKDTNLDVLHDREEFKKLLAELEAKLAAEKK